MLAGEIARFPFADLAMRGQSSRPKVLDPLASRRIVSVDGMGARLPFDDVDAATGALDDVTGVGPVGVGPVGVGPVGVAGDDGTFEAAGMSGAGLVFSQPIATREAARRTLATEARCMRASLCAPG